VTVYYSDIVGYTTIVAQSSALEMVEFLNALYRMTDEIVENYDAYKVSVSAPCSQYSIAKCLLINF
jgi:class 3 adenylate cyclase